MQSVFSLEEIGQMLDMKPSDVEKEIDNGDLGYTFEEGEKKVTLYDLEKYMGAERTREITREFFQQQNQDWSPASVTVFTTLWLLLLVG